MIQRLFFAVMVMITAARIYAADRPNILIAISDDQSWLHTSIQGCKTVHTPAFDRVARSGVLFENAFAPSPSCSPTRAALLTGLNIWQLENAGTHASSFPKKFVVFPDLLERAGYFVGYTGKGWAPGNWEVSGRTRNPAGPVWKKHSLKPPFSGIARDDYAKNFADFLAARPKGHPFCFWYGGREPHRGFQHDSWKKAGKKLSDVEVPPFLPDTPTVRGDILDYCVEIDWFDLHLARMVEMLRRAGELDNTLIIVTSDNGMSFPRAKANLYEYGVHEPLAISWPAKIPGGRRVDDVVGLVDVTATILDAAGVVPPKGDALSGRSLLKLLESHERGLVDPQRVAYFGRERHSSSRWHSLGYPSRAVRTTKYLYIRNFAPERWPMGAPQQIDERGKLEPEQKGYTDTDVNPTLKEMIARKSDPRFGRLLSLAVDHRPAQELYNIEDDPGCLHNLADDPAMAEVQRKLAGELDRELHRTGDPRVGSDPNVFETYPRYLPLRRFPEPEWAKKHPELVPVQPWLPESGR